MELSELETVIKGGLSLLKKGVSEVENFSPEDVRIWTAAALRTDGCDDETIQEAVEVMRKEKVRGKSLLNLTAASLERRRIPMGPASNLARRIQSLQAKKAGKEAIERTLFVSWFSDKDRS